MVPTRAIGAPAASDWDFPRAAGGVLVLVEHGVAAGVPAARLLHGSGLTARSLAEPGREVTAAQELRVVRNLCAALGDRPGLGIAVGAAYHVSTFGIFGYALLSSRTVLDAADLAMRYIDLSNAFSIFGFEVVGDEVVVEFGDADLPADVRRFLVERDLAAVHTVLDELLPGGVPLRTVELAFPASAAPEYATVLGCTPVFAGSGHRLRFEASWLDQPLPQSNPATQAMCEQVCRDVVERRRAGSSLTRQVRTLITQQLAFGGAMADVAAQLGQSPRTLRRRLAAEGTGFQALLDEVRESLALELLGTGALGVEDVALRLGYAEASSFIVAFRRWQGTTPTAWLAGADL